MVELDPEKFNPPKRFRKQNDHIWGPDGNGPDKDTQFFYVGQSAHEPYCRFNIHKQCFGKDIHYECECSFGPRIVTKSMSNYWVREYGQWLRKRKFSHYNQLTQSYPKSLVRITANKRNLLKVCIPSQDLTPLLRTTFAMINISLR